jgi:RNA polymerase primary sigma factor
MKQETIDFINKLKLKLNLIPLTERERSILSYRFGLTDNNLHTLEETGTQFGITRERVRQIQMKAKERLKMLQRA